MHFGLTRCLAPWRRLGPFIAAAIALSFSPSVLAQQDCFIRNDNSRLRFEVFQFSAPPPYEASESPYFPATDYVTSLPPLIARPPRGTSNFRGHYLLWANRCNFVQGFTPSDEKCRNGTRTKGNGYPNIVAGPLKDQLRAVFTTYEKANACTIASTMRLLGGSRSDIDTVATAAGINIVETGMPKEELRQLSRKVAVGKGRSQETSSVLLDTCIVENEMLPASAAGIVLDYEVFDNRTPNEALQFIGDMQRLVHKSGKQLILNTNPLPREPNGLVASSAAAVLDIVDGFAPTIASGASMGKTDIFLPERKRKHSPIEAYREALAVLTWKGPLSADQKRKLLFNISLFDLELAEAQFFHDEVLREGYRGIMFFRNYVKQGGSCSREANQVTACLALGDCDGRFGASR